MIKKVKNNVLWTYVINDITREEIVVTFYQKELQKANQKELKNNKFRKNDKKKRRKFNVKWKG